MRSYILSLSSCQLPSLWYFHPSASIASTAYLLIQFLQCNNTYIRYTKIGFDGISFQITLIRPSLLTSLLNLLKKIFTKTLSIIYNYFFWFSSIQIPHIVFNILSSNLIIHNKSLCFCMILLLFCVGICWKMSYNKLYYIGKAGNLLWNVNWTLFWWKMIQILVNALQTMQI